MNGQNIKPEIVAAITAAVQQMMGDKVIAVKIKRNDFWTLAGRTSRS
jgi:methylmalonyl-CoA carboxyltransferase large subunit